MIIRHIIVYTRYRRRGLFYTDSLFETAYIHASGLRQRA